MFDGIAGSYDRLNDLMTAGLHHRWRELAVMVAQVGPGCSALDVCCGTGDLAFALRRAVGPEGRVVGLDFSEDMLEVARDKCGRNQLYVEFMQGDVLALPFPDGAAGAPDATGAAATLAAAATGAAPAAPRRRLRRLHRGLRHPQRPRHRAGLQRDAPGLPARRAGRLPGDNPADHPGVQRVLRTLVPAGRAGARPLGRRGRLGVHVSARVGAALSRPRRNSKG